MLLKEYFCLQFLENKGVLLYQGVECLRARFFSMAKADILTISASELKDLTAISREYFLDPASYTTELSRTKDGLIIVGCIEPRHPASANPARLGEAAKARNIVQTPGGSVGVGVDAAIAMAVIENRQVAIQDGLLDERDRRTTSVLDSHENCRFINLLAPITERAAAPDEKSLERFRRWSNLHELVLTKRQQTHLTDAYAQLHEYYVTNGHASELVEFVDGSYPEYRNVRGVVGPNISRTYVVNHHPDRVLDRVKKSRLEGGLMIQAYHDSLGATLNTLKYSGLDRDERLLRAGSLVLRSAVTMGLMTEEYPMTEIEIFPSRDEGGIKIVEIDSLDR